MQNPNAYHATIQLHTPLSTILGKSCGVQLSTRPVITLSFAGNVAPVHGFFYAPESREDQEWWRGQSLVYELSLNYVDEKTSARTLMSFKLYDCTWAWWTKFVDQLWFVNLSTRFVMWSNCDVCNLFLSLAWSWMKVGFNTSYGRCTGMTDYVSLLI